MEGGAVTLNGSRHHDHDEDDLMSSNGMDDVMKPTPSGMEGADPMTMSGLFSRDLDPHSEGTETSTSTSNVSIQGGGVGSGGDAFGGCGMTDSFILQRDDDYGDSSQSSEQTDMLGSCGMTDSFMQLTNGSAVTGVEARPQQQQQQEQQQQQSDDAVLIDFGQPYTAVSASGAEERRLDSQAALFGEDLGHSQEALNVGYDVGDRQPVQQQGEVEDYHPGQPAPALSTNPFATEDPFQADPAPFSSSSTHPAMAAGIDLLIQSAPPPAHPFPEEQKGSAYNPFMMEESGPTRRAEDPQHPHPLSSDTAASNPFTLPSQTAEPSRPSEQGGKSHSYDLFGGRGAEEGEGVSPWQVTPPCTATVEAQREMEADVVSAPAFSHTQRADDEDFCPLREDGGTQQLPQEGWRQQEQPRDLLADLEMSAAPGAPRGTEDAFPSSQPPPSRDLMSEDVVAAESSVDDTRGADLAIHPDWTRAQEPTSLHPTEAEPPQEAEPEETQRQTAVEVHAGPEPSSLTVEREQEPEPSPEPAPPPPQEEPVPPPPQEEPIKPVATVVPQPAPPHTHIPQPASPKQIKSAADGKAAAKVGEKPTSRSPRKPPASPSKSGVPVKTTPTTTTSASRQRPTSASLSASGSRPASARAATKKEEATPKGTSTPTSRPRTAPGARTSKDASQGGQGAKSDVSKPAGKSPATRTPTSTTTKSTPSKLQTTPKNGSTGGRGEVGSRGGAPRTPTTGASSPASSASGSTSSARKAEVRSKVGSLDNASHTPGGGNVKITSKKPDVSTVQSKIGSKDKMDHKPGGGNVKIESKKVEVGSVKSRIGSLDNAKHSPRGGDKKIESKKLDWKVQSKVGSMDNARHVAGGGDKKIEQRKLDWKAQSKVGSLDNAAHTPGGGEKKIETQKLDFKEKAASKVGSLDNAKHVPGGGDKQIESQKLDFRDTAKAKTDSGKAPA